VNLLQTCTGVLALVTLAACGKDPDLAAGNLPAVGRGPTTATLLRVPREGGLTRLYRVPGLDASSWKMQDKLPPLERVIGADPEQGLVYCLDRKRNVVGIDLETHRVRTYTEQVRNAFVGPDGSLFTIDTGDVVTQLVRRTPVRFRSKLQGTPQELNATMSGSVLARVAGKKPGLEVLGPDQAPTTTTIADGDMTQTLWGDLVAVAGPKGVTVYQTQGKEKPRTLDVDGAKAAMFSPSGHRLYVVRETGTLVIFDRYSWDKLDEVDLPGPAVALRGDLYGQWVLIRPAIGDSAWVFDVGRNHLVGSAPAHWEGSLPQVVSPNTLLTRQGDRLVALDLGAKDFPRRGAIDDSTEDLFIPLAWHPAQDEPVPAESDSASLAAADSTRGATVYLQVSSSQNPAWADELSQRLRAAGLPASVLKPKRSDEPHRVVLGPYPTREQAEEAGRKIGMPSFVVTTQDQATP
jgi:sporulation related protein